MNRLGYRDVKPYPGILFVYIEKFFDFKYNKTIIGEKGELFEIHYFRIFP